jgi:ABC-type uncharacterized transport system ATPase subunit
MDSPIIVVEHLKKYFKVPQKTEGLKASFGALFNRKFKQVKAVDDVSFSIHEGEMVVRACRVNVILTRHSRQMLNMW